MRVTSGAGYRGDGAGTPGTVSSELLRLVVGSATGFAVIAFDSLGVITMWNVGAERLLGYSERDMIGGGIETIFTPEDRQALIPAIEMRIALSEGRAGDDRWLLHRNGTRFWGAGLMMPLAEAGAGFIKIIRDCTPEKRATEWLAQIERQLRDLIEGMPQLIWRSADDGLWSWASPQWLDYTGQSQEASQELGWMAAVYPDDRGAVTAAWSTAAASGSMDVEMRVRRASDGAWNWHRSRALLLPDETGKPSEWLGTTTDIQTLKEAQQRQTALLTEAHLHGRALETEIQERKLVEAELLYSAFHDDLTRLRNRAYFIQRVTIALQRMRDEPDYGCAVLFMDVDRFKLVNDSLGHPAGDALLAEVSRRLKACVGGQGTLARLGGDEFGVLIENVATMKPVVALACTIIETMRRPLWLGAQEILVSCSIGLVEATPQHRLPQELLRDADTAMYHAKRHDTGGYVIFAATMHNQAVDALQLQIDLRRAVSRQEFVLHYQLIWRTSTSEIIGLEALLRWQHPERGLLLPNGFIAAAEETGLLRVIGRWVLREACTQAIAWRSRFPGIALHLNVNISADELRDPEFVAIVQDTLEETGIPPASLTLEVTESVFLRQPEHTGATLSTLRALGVRIALDDFGTGFSSLGSLDRYPMDTIKIDRSFVAGMANRPRSIAIVEWIVALGKAMRLDVIAEGVEDQRQLQTLTEMGCGAVQGHLLGAPMPAHEVTQVLERQEVL